MKKALPLVLALVLLVVGCGEDAATVTPAAINTLAPVEVEQPTDTAQATDLPAPTNTVEATKPPEPTDTLVPTDTPVPTDTAEPTVAPVPTVAPMPTITQVAPEGKLHEQLTGTWVSELMTVTFDWENGTYSGVGLGEMFERKLTLVEEGPNYVVFLSDESTIVAQFLDDGSILLKKQIEGGIPVILTRAP